MKRLCPLVLLVAALFACSATRATPSAAQPVTQPVVVAAPDVTAVTDAAAPDAANATDDAPAADDAASDAPPARDPRLAWLRTLSNGGAPMTGATDPARGLTVVHYIEAPPSGQGGESISTQHHCGAALTRQLPALRQVLAAIVEQADANEAFDCNASECIVPGMEYQPAWHVLFVDVQGAPRIEAVMQLSEAAMNEAWLARVNAYVTRSLTAARAHPCPQRRP